MTDKEMSEDEVAEMFREAFRRLGYPPRTTEPPDIPSEERFRLADEIFERDIKPQVKDRDEMDFVAIDAKSGQWAVGSDDLVVLDELHGKCPTAHNVILRRVGFRTVGRFGGRRLVR